MQESTQGKLQPGLRNLVLHDHGNPAHHADQQQHEHDREPVREALEKLK